jgi:hypothetical protein
MPISIVAGAMTQKAECLSKACHYYSRGRSEPAPAFEHSFECNVASGCEAHAAKKNAFCGVRENSLLTTI